MALLYLIGYRELEMSFQSANAFMKLHLEGILDSN